ncbi:hypothetical protein AB0H42_23390 [Nocardia sp. NPDC050799]|uniref:hypothetical protein n=1 Tax=Nocardia sp. NPDC050799 TaxID=3154842 RepID=UPI0033F7E75B
MKVYSLLDLGGAMRLGLGDSGSTGSTDQKLVSGIDETPLGETLRPEPANSVRSS